MAAVEPAREGLPATTSAADAIASHVEILQSHLEFVLDERVGPLSVDQRRFLALAARHGRLLARPSEDLETLARAEAGRLEPEWAPCDLAAIAADALRQVSPAAAIRHKQIELRAAKPVWAVGAAKHVGRAALELVELAVWLAAAESSVRVFAAPVLLEVSYEGPPPAGDELPLSLVRAVATAHGGAFVCEGSGGSVRLCLSLVPE